MKLFNWSGLDAAGRREALARPVQRRDPRVTQVVSRIFAEVAAEGAAAVSRWALTLDGHAPRTFEVDAAALARARSVVAAADLEALEFAADNVRRYHQAIRPVETAFSPAPGVVCRRVWRAIPTCGLYAPGGTAPLFSTLLMLAIPARVAGVAQATAVTPPARDGSIHPMMILAAKAAGLDAIEAVGGAQAIAALTFGAGLPKACKIFGPGNAYVAEAKRLAADTPGGPAIDMPAGPSELMVIADHSADPEIVAADLLSQAEHDADAQVLLVATAAGVIEAVLAAVERQVCDLPRVKLARQSLAEGRAILVRSAEEACEVANAYAPEHLSLQVASPGALIDAIVAAGAVFIGRWTAETLGDYVVGPSHVLPTDGAATAFSGISVASFMTSLAVQEVGPESAGRFARCAARLARLEGLEAHARAADLRTG